MSIPRTALARPAATARRTPAYSLLVRRIPRRGQIFDGRFLRAGSHVEESALWPDPRYPQIPLLIEFAGTEYGGGIGNNRGHNRAPDVHVLWRYSAPRHEFDEIARTASHGAEWFHHLRPIVEREIRRPALSGSDHADAARRVSLRLLAALDSELDELEDEGRANALGLLYNQVAARFAAAIADSARPLRGSLFGRETRARRDHAA